LSEDDDSDSEDSNLGTPVKSSPEKSLAANISQSNNTSGLKVNIPALTAMKIITLSFPSQKENAVLDSNHQRMKYVLPSQGGQKK
jgi:hypothetical protein